jgi:hypothetical protein
MKKIGQTNNEWRGGREDEGIKADEWVKKG